MMFVDEDENEEGRELVVGCDADIRSCDDG